MPETHETPFNLVNSLVYYTHQAREFYQLLLYSVELKSTL